jgi:methionyl-tRNA synthetase
MTEAKNAKKIYITTAIDYTNAIIHIGQAYEKILADCFARYYREKLGKENVFFTTGTDEHGTTNAKAAKDGGIPPQEHVDFVSKQDKEQIDSLNISYDRFIRTTDDDHKKVASDFFQKSFDAGDIYKGSYEGLYCEGCEAHKTLSELNEDKRCKLHPSREIQKHEEENYFFKWSKYEGFLRGLLEKPGFSLPDGKRKEMLGFINSGIQDIPVTRPKYKLNWGVVSPIDPEQVIYVWFDALVNYFTFGSEKKIWNEDTKIIHFVGKDINRWHSLLWPAMLKSAGYRIPDVIYTHGFITLDGQKISKSLGNVISPQELVDQFGSDAVRYYFLKHGPITEDVDVSIDHIKEVYNADLANGIGNTAARLAKLAEKSDFEFPATAATEKATGKKEVWNEGAVKTMEEDYRVDLVLSNTVWANISELNKHINQETPWAIEDKTKLKEVLTYEIGELRKIAEQLKPFIPETAEKIQKQFGSAKIKSGESLFPRL